MEEEDKSRLVNESAASAMTTQSPRHALVATSVEAIFGSPRGRRRPKSLEFRSMKSNFDAELTNTFGSLSGLHAAPLRRCIRVSVVDAA